MTTKLIPILVVLSCIALAAPATAQTATGAGAANETTISSSSPTPTAVPNVTASTATSTSDATTPDATATATPYRNAAEAAASENLTAPAGAPSSKLVLDRDVVVKDYDSRGGDMLLWFWSDETKVVNVAPMIEGDGTGTMQSQPIILNDGNTTFARIESTGGVTLWTDRSMQDQRFHYITAGGSSLISGPWSGADVRHAGIGGALGVVIPVLYEAVAAKVGSGEPGERLA